MVTSEGLAFNVDSWLLHDAFSHDSDLLAKALHNTVSAAATPPPPHPYTLPPSVFFDSSSTHTPSSNVSGGSDQENINDGGAKRKRNCILTEGKATKRRARASKKPQTTFITADPSNFREMVQKVTGAKYNINHTSSLLFAPIVKPELHRLSSITSEKSTAVPTLDTSAFLSNNLLGGNIFSGGSDSVGLPSAKASATVDSGGSAVEFYPTFPTLESWKVM